jgi:hypothetical protein
MKKAFLVKASVMTRVVVDVPEDYNEDNAVPMDIWEKVVDLAIPRLKNNINDFDSIEEVEPDFECPYGSGYNEDNDN